MHVKKDPAATAVSFDFTALKRSWIAIGRKQSVWFM